MKLVLRLSLLLLILVACGKHSVLPEPEVTVKPKPGVDTVKGLPKTNTYTQKKLQVVVIGSSTVAGVGPASTDSAIVNRIRKWLTDQNPQAKVTNLGVGGTTTFQGLPYAQRGPAGLPPVDTTFNTDAALKLKPEVVVVSYPSNDFTLNVKPAVIEQNFNTIYEALSARDVKVVFLGIQPRSFNTVQVAMQAEVDTYMKSRYGINYVQVYQKLKNADGSINPTYSAGDGVHLNNAGHRVLFEGIISQCSDIFLK